METPEESNLETQVASVVKLMQQEWPTCVDYNVNDAGEVELLDANNAVVAKITTEQLTKLYNDAEGHQE
jgi:hypothetical protein